MVKKLLALTLGLTLAIGASATITFPSSSVQYWVGTGTNQAVVILGWDDNPNGNFALAWGVRWNGSATAANMLDTIATYDSRVSYSISSGFVTSIGYNDGTLVSGSTASYWCYTLNGGSAGAYGSQAMTNGDLMEVSSSCNFSLTTASPATDPNASTVTEATIATSDILYWVGTGSNQAILAVNWADTALAWGYRWNGTATVADMMDAIAADDPRFSYSGSGWLNDITFNDGTVNLAGTPGNYWGSTNNGFMDMGLDQTIADGDFEKWGDPAAGVIVDSMEYSGTWYYTYAYPMTIHPVSVPGVVEATIAASDILYWVGTGSNQAIMAVNWADTALAWGYRWNGTATVADMMDAIAADDPRFSYSGTGFLNDINYIDTAAGMTDTLGITPGNYWGSTNNSVMDMGLGQTLVNGDFEKWGDPAAGVIVDSTYDANYNYWWYTYAYPMTIHPVSIPDSTGHGTEPEHGPFCGAVGTEGCNAIAADSNIIVAWATGCTVERGPVDITNPDGPLAFFGTDQMGIGPATNSTTNAVSLGDGGTATLTFALPIANGEGPDFAVFENSFNDNFLELAFVEVSSDGEHFVRFPATSLTPTDVQVGTYGTVDPTYINNLAGKYRIAYGTPFDLDELSDSTGINIDNITHVRIVDVVGSIDPQYATYDAFGHMVNDPWPTNDTSYGSGGFDLTGVAVINQNTNGIEDVTVTIQSVYPNPTAGQIMVSATRNASATIFDLSGRRMVELDLHAGSNRIDITTLPTGVYMLRAEGCVTKIVKY